MKEHEVSSGDVLRRERLAKAPAARPEDSVALTLVQTVQQEWRLATRFLDSLVLDLLGSPPYAPGETFGPRSSVLSDNALIQALERGSDALLERGESKRAGEAQRAASDLRESIRLYREAVDEVVRCGKRATSPAATADDAVAAELAQAVMRNRWAAVKESRDRCARILDRDR